MLSLSHLFEIKLSDPGVREKVFDISNDWSKRGPIWGNKIGAQQRAEKIIQRERNNIFRTK